jgi:ATP-dependent exoDNAse (exonuclease V) beta subunit
MKFAYPQLTSSDFRGQRWYHIDEDTVYPSITTILGNTEPVEKKNRLQAWVNAIGATQAKQHNDRAKLRGEQVHLMIEQFLRGESINVPGATDLEHRMFQSMKLPLRKIHEVWGQECALFSTLLEVAGRTDCIGIYDGVPSIIDFKTSGRFKNDKEIEDYWLQCAFYATAHNEMFGTNIQQAAIIMGVENAMPMVWKKTITDEMMLTLITRAQEFFANLKV